jgi:hypothetical protein
MTRPVTWLTQATISSRCSQASSPGTTVRSCKQRNAPDDTLILPAAVAAAFGQALSDLAQHGARLTGERKTVAWRTLPRVDELPLDFGPVNSGTLEPDLSRWLQDLSVLRRFEAKVFRGAGSGCHPWLGAISSSGHGKFHLGAGDAAMIVSAHRFAYQIEHGPLVGGTVMHACDEHSCVNTGPGHLILGTSGTNTRDYYRDRHGALSPLADPRGRSGRAMAIRDAILTAGPAPAVRLLAYRAASAIPLPWAEQSGQLPLF